MSRVGGRVKLNSAIQSLIHLSLVKGSGVGKSWGFDYWFSDWFLGETIKIFIGIFSSFFGHISFRLDNSVQLVFQRLLFQELLFLFFELNLGIFLGNDLLGSLGLLCSSDNLFGCGILKVVGSFFLFLNLLSGLLLHGLHFLLLLHQFGLGFCLDLLDGLLLISGILFSFLVSSLDNSLFLLLFFLESFLGLLLENFFGLESRFSFESGLLVSLTLNDSIVFGLELFLQFLFCSLFLLLLFLQSSLSFLLSFDFLLDLGISLSSNLLFSLGLNLIVMLDFELHLCIGLFFLLSQ